MQQAVREGRIENHREPVHRHHNAVYDFMPLRGLHPAVGCQDPEGGHQCAERNHTGGEIVQLFTDTVPAEQHHAEETGFQEERGQNFIGEQRTGD